MIPALRVVAGVDFAVVVVVLLQGRWSPAFAATAIV